MATAMLATAIVSEAGDNDKAVKVRVGSGTISTAPMAVKWCETMARVKSNAEANTARVPGHDTATANAAIPSNMPMTIEANTSGMSQVIRPGSSSAHMPR